MCISSVLLADQNLPDPHDHRSLAGGGCVLHGLIIEIALAKLDRSALLQDLERALRLELAARLYGDHRATLEDTVGGKPRGSLIAFVLKDLAKVLAQFFRRRLRRGDRRLTELATRGELDPVRWEAVTDQSRADTLGRLMIGEQRGEYGAHSVPPRNLRPWRAGRPWDQAAGAHGL